jgi:haloalkane dehalogenase
MKRRDFLCGSFAASGGVLLSRTLASAEPANLTIDAKAFHASRRFANLPLSRVACVERGYGPAALFIHGYPLNGFQWRGAIERLQAYRCCIATDVMGMGYTPTPRGQKISPETPATILVMWLDSLHINAVDLVDNDSGGLVAQLFLAKYPSRVRTLLLTNCDVDENSLPAQFLPFIEQAKKGTFVDEFIVPQLKDKQFARSRQGMGGLAFTNFEHLADETIETYFRPLLETPLKRSQANEYAVSMATNSLVAICEVLHRWKSPERMVWGLKDVLFSVKWAEWLHRTLPGSRDVRRVEGANLFFPEEMPDLIAEEAARLWNDKSLGTRGIL